MYNTIFSVALLGVLFFVGVPPVSAHQPVYVGAKNQIEIVDPEISKAFYGTLEGAAAVYRIVATEPFTLYVNILLPEGANEATSTTVTIQRGSEHIATLSTQAWSLWYEEFAGDWYQKGTEYKKDVPAGEYSIEVKSNTYAGRYVLAVGEAEVFTFRGIPHTFTELYGVKTQFFEKPWYSIFSGVIGKSIAVFGAVVLLLVLGITYGVVRKWRR